MAALRVPNPFGQRVTLQTRHTKRSPCSFRASGLANTKKMLALMPQMGTCKKLKGQLLIIPSLHAAVWLYTPIDS